MSGLGQSAAPREWLADRLSPPRRTSVQSASVGHVDAAGSWTGGCARCMNDPGASRGMDCSVGGFRVSNKREALMRRRDLLSAMTAGVAIAAVAPVDKVKALPANVDEKRKARYQANSPEVQEFYRVNRYPPQ
jgi:hypothetical protein